MAPFQLAPAFRQPVRQQLHDVAGDAEGGIGGTLLLGTLLQDLQPERRIERADLGDQAALQTRAHAIVETIELSRRAGRGHHHLAPSVEQRVDDVLELLLGLLAAHEFQIVDQQDVDLAELLLEGQAVLGLDRLDELVAEALRRQVQHLRLRRAPLHLPGDGMLEVRLAEADRGMQVERIEAAVVGEHRLGHLGGGGMRQAIGRSDHEAVEGIARIERRALEAVDVRAPHHHAGTRADGNAPHLGCARLGRMRKRIAWRRHGGQQPPVGRSPGPADAGRGRRARRR